MWRRRVSFGGAMRCHIDESHGGALWRTLLPTATPHLCVKMPCAETNWLRQRRESEVDLDCAGGWREAFCDLKAA